MIVGQYLFDIHLQYFHFQKITQQCLRLNFNVFITKGHIVRDFRFTSIPLLKCENCFPTFSNLYLFKSGLKKVHFLLYLYYILNTLTYIRVGKNTLTYIRMGKHINLLTDGKKHINLPTDGENTLTCIRMGKTH